MNSKEQGGIGVVKAIAYFGSQGHAVFVPVADIRRYDLVVDMFGVLKKVEVKTTTQLNGQLDLRTSGGNQSWNKEVKRISTDDCDLVYCTNLLTNSERVYTSSELEGKSSIRMN
jgi:hypothetical protein